jgi:GNAT superfamily N-acetyltransferase
MSELREPIQLRPFAVGDAPRLAKWLALAGLAVPAGTPAEVWVKRIQGNDRILCLSAVDVRDRLIGFLRLDIGPDRVAELTLIVAPEHRRRGLGRRLLEAVLVEARRRGLRRLTAAVSDHNDGALQFFLDGGFEETGHWLPGFVHLSRVVHGADRQPPLEIFV